MVDDEEVRGRMLAQSGQELVQGSAGLAGRGDPAVAYQAGEGLWIDAAVGQIAAERRTISGSLTALDEQAPNEGRGNRPCSIFFPQGSSDATLLSEEDQRELYHAFHLQVRYDRTKHQVTLRATIYADAVGALTKNIRSLISVQSILITLDARVGPNAHPLSVLKKIWDLEQAGRTERGVYPPETLWSAFTAAVTDPDLLLGLGERAIERGRYQHAIWLYARAADLGDPRALWELARWREAAGDDAGAEALYPQAVDRGHTTGFRQLAWLRVRSGDRAGAEALAVKAAGRGHTAGLLAELRATAGDQAGAKQIRRFGLTGPGQVAAGLDFGSYGGPVI